MTERSETTHALEPGWHTRAASDADRLRQLYQSLDTLAQGQRELIEDHHTEGLLDLLLRRRGIIDQIKELSLTLRPVLEGWDRLDATVPEPARSTLRSAIEEINALTETILTRDSEHSQTLAEQRTQIASELVSIDRGRAAVSAYSGHPASRPQTPHFQDREG